MNKLQKEQELIDVTANRLSLADASVVEKDLYLTRALAALSTISSEYFDLVFQGGTCLAKAHHIIQRMSEDCDYRIRFKKQNVNISKEAKRRTLRKFRQDLVKALRQNGFDIEDKELRVRNEGQFMSVRARYPSIFPIAKGIKPYLAIEFFLGEVKTPIEEKTVTTLVQQTLGEKVNHPILKINCVSVIETAAEKWVALTRRVATMSFRQHYRDTSLIRHVYDIYRIDQQGLFNKQFTGLVCRIVQDDRQQYKKHNDAYYKNPVAEIKRAIKILEHEPEFQENWNNFMATMVYDSEKPSYQQVIVFFKKKSAEALEALSKLSFD